MWNFGRRSNRWIFSSLIQTNFMSLRFKTTQFMNSSGFAESASFGNKTQMGRLISDFSNPFFPSSITTCRFSSTHVDVDDDDNDFDADGDDEDCDGLELSQLGTKDEGLIRNVETVLGFLRDFGRDAAEVKRRLEGCSVPASPELVAEVLSRVRNDWEAAFTFFLWAGKQPGYVHSVREYHSMISILGRMRKFDTAWALIDEMRGGKDGPSLVTPQTLLIIIRRYCAVHDVGKAIGAFYAFKRFGFKIGVEEFQDLLCALCRYKNVQDAEHLLLCKENVFPFDTKSFNIVLNGWCNMMVNLRQAKRFWWDMGKRGIARDAFSYGSMISCYSKASSLRDVLKLFDEMKELGITPDRKVYNAVVYALAKGNCLMEAINLVKTMEDKGCVPNAVTYNSLIKPLCKARRVDDARAIFDEMLGRGISPSVRTYHAFFAILRTAEEVFELLHKMEETGCCPTNDTYIMLIRKFCRWRQLDNVFKLWNEMGMKGLSPDRSSYIVLIHGLFLNGKLDEAHKYYEEMKTKGFAPEPKTDEMLKAWVSGKETAMPQILDLEGNKEDHCTFRKNTRGTSNTVGPNRDFRKPETRSVTRERGFSFW
ncbi:pentatricopeptide repeat-containing protein At5g15010, mitochondrial-like [Magnolia sinica]|uniref:pentatricopeptide repeat-containing protein At5g15010, mitochondrial-like n=1 Tax=Magnolia sinica TaxID=86752 RepID=UPI00265B1278|nr:pentatricopeptide repeat-containing protein At5g15010, mitochondrial-like [Magnolia sinica]